MLPNAAMGESLAMAALERVPKITCRVELDEKGRLQWRATIDGVEVIETSELLTSGFKRFQAFLLKIVPDSQL